MDTQNLTRTITKTLVILVFWIVFGISLFIRETISINDLLFDLAKSLVVSGIFWVIFLIISDTMIKSIVHSAKSENADRFEGEMSYHILDEAPEEKQWQKHYKEKHETKKPE